MRINSITQVKDRDKRIAIYMDMKIIALDKGVRIK